MSLEATVNATVAYDDGVSSDSAQLVDRLVTIGTQKFRKWIQTIGITEEAIDIGEIVSPGILFAINLDPTNFVSLRVATGGAKFHKLRADTNSDGKGGISLGELDSGAQTPFAIADTAPCRVLFFLISQ